MLASVFKCKWKETLLCYSNQHKQGQTLSPDSCNSVNGSWHSSTRTQMWSLLQLYLLKHGPCLPLPSKITSITVFLIPSWISSFHKKLDHKSWPPVKRWIDSPQSDLTTESFCRWRCQKAICSENDSMINQTEASVRSSVDHWEIRHQFSPSRLAVIGQYILATA